MSRIVRYEWGPNGPPPLTEAQKAEIEALKRMPDSEIDFSDIPPLEEKFWANAVRNPDIARARKAAKKVG